MALLHVLIDASGNVLGTSAVVAASGSNPPVSATLVAGPGQRLTQLTVDDKMAALEAGALHTALKGLVK